MTSTPANFPVNGSKGSPIPPEEALALSPANGATGLLARLPGLDSPDSLTLVGRNRLSQALELEEKPDNRYLRLSLYVLGAAALIFFPWAALTPITQVVNASGEVTPQGEVNVVQHLEGGIVAKVDVADGDEVRAGQVMLELRPNLVESEYTATQQQLSNLMLQQQQLQAAIRGDRILPGEPGKVGDAQRQLLNSRIDNREDQIARVQAQIAQKQAEINGLNDQIAKFERERGLYAEQRRMYADLVETGAASRLNLLNADQQVAALEHQAGGTAGGPQRGQQAAHRSPGQPAQLAVGHSAGAELPDRPAGERRGGGGGEHQEGAQPAGAHQDHGAGGWHGERPALPGPRRGGGSGCGGDGGGAERHRAHGGGAGAFRRYRLCEARPGGGCETPAV
jgi:hypothetical protein